MLLVRIGNWPVLASAPFSLTYEIAFPWFRDDYAQIRVVSMSHQQTPDFPGIPLMSGQFHFGRDYAAISTAFAFFM